MSTALSVKTRKAWGQAGYVPRVREPNEALPPQINRLAGTYTPPPAAPTRPGAGDFLKIKSTGQPC